MATPIIAALIPTERTLKTRWFYAFFFISGFCSLVYELIWLRLAMAKFGVTTPMVSIVLSVFMAGLGIGSWLGGAFIRRFERSSAAVPLRLYGLLELVIGLSGFVAPFLITTGSSLLESTGRNLDWGSSLFYLVSGSWILVALLPWCTCMGATFPFAMAAIRKIDSKQSEHSFSYLYLANVLGAVLGTLVPAFVLIELFGFGGTLLIASALNALLAFTVFAFAFGRFSLPEVEDMRTAPVNAPAFRHNSGNTMLWLLFTTGLCSMAMEVVWIRQFTVFLGNVVYAFALILAIYLVATFLGSAGYRRWVRTHEPKSIGAEWIPLGLLSLLPLLFADPRLPSYLGKDTGMNLAYGALRAALGIAPFSALVGFVTPMLVDRWSGGSPDRAGRAYAVNVLGSILGPLLAGFWVLPLAGERWGLCLLSLPLFAVGLVSVLSASDQFFPFLKLKLAPVYGVSVVFALLLAIFTRNYGTQFPKRIEMRDHTATVIATGAGMNRRLLVNGIGMTKLTPITKMMVHLPLSFLNRPARNGLVICFGMGTSFRSMMSWGIDVTVVELVPSVPKLFGYFHPDGPELMRLPRAHVVIDDGRRFLERSDEQFDVIAADPPPPIAAPASSLLYSQEFYAILKPHLRPGGIVQVWCPGGDNATMAAITKALRGAFPYIRAFDSIEGWGTHFLASMQPLPDVTPDSLARNMPAAAAADMVEFNPDSTPQKMFGAVLDEEDSLQDYITPDPSAPAIRDDRPINEYFLLRAADPKLPI